VSESCCIEASRGNRCGCQYEEIDRLEQENKELRECVEFYADFENECCGDYAPPNRARQCLQKLKDLK